MRRIEKELSRGRRLRRVVPALEQDPPLRESRVVEVLRIVIVRMKAVVVHDQHRVRTGVVTDPQKALVEARRQATKLLILERLAVLLPSGQSWKPIERRIQEAENQEAADGGNGQARQNPCGTGPYFCACSCRKTGAHFCGTRA